MLCVGISEGWDKDNSVPVGASFLVCASKRLSAVGSGRLLHFFSEITTSASLALKEKKKLILCYANVALQYRSKVVAELKNLVI
jgi:hypothetical protein